LKPYIRRTYREQKNSLQRLVIKRRGGEMCKAKKKSNPLQFSVLTSLLTPFKTVALA